MQKSLKKYFPVFALPTVAAFCVSFLIPFVMGLYLSFCKFTTIKKVSFVGIKNFVAIFADEGFLNALWFTVKFTVVSVITINVLAFVLAYILTRGLKGTNLFRTTFFTPNLIGGIVLGYIWQIIINGVLKYFDVTITYSAKYGFWGLVILMNWQLIGYMMIIYIAGIQNIPKDLIDSAAVDGAGRLKTLTNVTIPMVMPSVTICLFLTLTNSFKLFDQNYALTDGAPNGETQMLALNIFKSFYNTSGSKGTGQAKAVIFFLIVGVIAFIQLVATRNKEVEN